MDPFTPPKIPPEIVSWLSSVFPDKLPDPATPQHEILARCGEQRVIRTLRATLAHQTENVLEEPILHQ